MYAIGDFVHLEFCDHGMKEIIIGIIVKKILRDEHLRKLYWFADEYNYLISIQQYNGDYTWKTRGEIVNRVQHMPVEYKLSYIGQLGDWWFNKFQNILAVIMIDMLLKRKSLM